MYIRIFLIHLIIIKIKIEKFNPQDWGFEILQNCFNIFQFLKLLATSNFSKFVIYIIGFSKSSVEQFFCV